MIVLKVFILRTKAFKRCLRNHPSKRQFRNSKFVGKFRLKVLFRLAQNRMIWITIDWQFTSLLSLSLTKNVKKKNSEKKNFRKKNSERKKIRRKKNLKKNSRKKNLPKKIWGKVGPKGPTVCSRRLQPSAGARKKPPCRGAELSSIYKYLSGIFCITLK